MATNLVVIGLGEAAMGVDIIVLSAAFRLTRNHPVCDRRSNRRWPYRLGITCSL
jgi:hypothetical protein